MSDHICEAVYPFRGIWKILLNSGGGVGKRPSSPVGEGTRVRRREEAIHSCRHCLSYVYIRSSQHSLDLPINSLWLEELDSVEMRDVPSKVTTELELLQPVGIADGFHTPHDLYSTLKRSIPRPEGVLAVPRASFDS